MYTCWVIKLLSDYGFVYSNDRTLMAEGENENRTIISATNDIYLENVVVSLRHFYSINLIFLFSCQAHQIQALFFDAKHI